MMVNLIETRTTEVYRIGCPHCRSTLEHTKEATLTVTRDAGGKILDLRLDCDWARQTGQDRT